MSELSGDGETADSPDTPSGGTGDTSVSRFCDISDAQVEAMLAAEDEGFEEDQGTGTFADEAPGPRAGQEEQPGQTGGAAASLQEGTAQPDDDNSASGEEEQAGQDEDGAGTREAIAQPGGDVSALGDSASGTSPQSSDDEGPEPHSGDIAADRDGDVSAMLSAGEQQPEPRADQEASGEATPADHADSAQSARPDVPDDSGGPECYSPDAAAEYDGDVTALLAEEDLSPGPNPRQLPAPDTSAEGTTPSRADADPGATSPRQPDAGPEPSPVSNAAEDGVLDPGDYRVAVHGTSGADVPLAVEYLPPEARTVGDTTPTGIGRKPSGEEIRDMETDDPVKNRSDRLLMEVIDDAGDARDAATSIAETLHDLRLPGPDLAAGHAHEGHSAGDLPQAAGTGYSDALGGVVLVGVAMLTGVPYLFRRLGKGDRR